MQIADTNVVDAGALFETYRDRIHRYVLHLVRDAAEAEDLAQETFLRAHRSRETLRDQGAVCGWLYRIATRVCLDRLRQRKPQVSLSGREGDDSVNSIAAVSPSALEDAEHKETSECVQRCLQFLPDHYRAVVLMHEVYSLTAAEIASLTGANLSAIKMRLHRARRMLEMVMECGCAVSNDACGLPTCSLKTPVQKSTDKSAARKTRRA